jgi:hypothetical protein
MNLICVLGTNCGNYYKSINGENFKHKLQHFLDAIKSILFSQKSFKAELLNLITACKSLKKGWSNLINSYFTSKYIMLIDQGSAREKPQSKKIPNPSQPTPNPWHCKEEGLPSPKCAFLYTPRPGWKEAPVNFYIQCTENCLLHRRKLWFLYV